MSLKAIVDGKREWKQLNKRVEAMPEDYIFVYKQMQKYIFKTKDLNSEQAFKIFGDILDLFEEGITNNLHILEITGRDVATFCDNMTSDYSSYIDTVQAEVEASIEASLKKIK